MRVNHNMTSLNILNLYSKNTLHLQKSMQKLSSGLRINSASDDVAGLAISEKMRSQIRGLKQSSRNLQDGISLVQTAEGALNEVHNLLQRGRELAVQASNGTLSDTDKQAIQEEMNQIFAEIDNISKNTNFNGINLFSDKSIPPLSPTPPTGETGSTGGTENPPPEPENPPVEEPDTKPPFPTDPNEQIIYTLKQSALEQSEKIIEKYYGLKADGVDLTIVINQNDNPNTLAYVSYYIDPETGKGFNISLNIDKADFLPPEPENGGTYPIYNDRIIAHELTHAVMSRNMNFYALPKWFKEGTAEFIHGGDERLYADIYYKGQSAVVNAIGNGTDSSWVNDSLHYSNGYVAVRYLHHRIKEAGGEGIKEIMTYLKEHQGSTLDQALRNIAHGSYSGGLSAFVSDFKANGVNFISTMDLTNADTGAIGGFDADGLEIKTPESVVPFVDNYTDDPMEGFNEIWPETSSMVEIPNMIHVVEVSWVPPTTIGMTGVSHNVEITPQQLKTLRIQAGANANSAMDLEFSKIDAESMNLSDINVVDNPQDSISKFDAAIGFISSERAKFGAYQNRMEHAIRINDNTAENLTTAESKIRDVDMAKEIVEFTKRQILQQSMTSLLAQANKQPQMVLNLLR